MKIKTDQFGEIEFHEDKVIKFEPGIFGFENLRQYLLIKTEDELFYWLYSTEKPEIAFPLVGLALVDSEFPTKENNEVFGIVTLSKDPLQITVNLKAPVYINQNNKIGFQEIIDSEKYPVNYKLFIGE